VDTVRDRQGSCGFCDGTGRWADSDEDLAAADPCPLCEGSGVGPEATAATGEEPQQAAEAVTVARLIAVLPRLSQPDRQRLYEELHAIYDCRIYRR
jgi:hypothetical protein